MSSATQRQRILRVLLIASIISTAIHFVDNYRYFEHYPQPDWITPPGVYRSWILWTLSAVAGYWLYQHNRVGLSHLCLVIYSTCGLSSLAHYLYGHLSEFTPKMHLFILTDAMAGFAILGFTIWSGLIMLRGKSEVSSQRA